VLVFWHATWALSRFCNEPPKVGNQARVDTNRDYVGSSLPVFPHAPVLSASCQALPK